jgi:hypothetical protein
MTPTKAGTTVLLKAMQVLVAISWGVVVALLGCLDPGVTILGFKRHPSKKMLLSWRALNVNERTLSVTF